MRRFCSSFKPVIVAYIPILIGLLIAGYFVYPALSEHTFIWTPIAVVVTVVILLFGFFALFIAPMNGLFFVELYDDRIVFQNYILRFWRSEFIFGEIERCVIDSTRGMNYFKIFYNGKSSYSYVTNMVKFENYNLIIVELERAGVVIELRGEIIKN